ncbi:MAG TPA: transcriptional regulator [Candidatus Angelobacter sp.]|nr:transcriptional regulator [Candidatus Angelobacter sp.]
MARQSFHQSVQERAGERGRRRTEDHQGPGFPEFDPLVHERMRLGIISALATNESLSFNDLKRLLRTTDGNLSVHGRKLEEAGYVTCSKGFNGRIPRSDYRLTARGRKALARYLEQMEELIRRTKD